MLQGTAEAKTRAKRLRRDMSLPEVLLWQRLKTRPMGLKFRKQHDAGNYVLDFYCHEVRLIIEVDGIAHDMGDQPGRDSKRDAEFTTKGFRVVRIPAVDVLRDPDQAAESIAAIGAARRAGEAS
jgi:very-short-patch-repair endonuclease